MQLEGRVALITGAGSGIGRAAAKRLAQEGCKIGGLGHTEDELEEAMEEIRSEGGEAMSLVADISEAEDMQEAVNKIVSKWGRLDIVFANAGINGVWAPVEDLKPEEWRETLDINLTGTFLTIKYAVPHLKKRGGSVIVTSSVNGNRIFTNTGATAYSCSKAGQVALTMMLAVELGPQKIRVNVICPGAIETNIGENTEQRNLDDVTIPVKFPEGKIPLTGGKPGSSEQVADLVLFLASDASNHVTGAQIFIDGAESLLQG
jgi:NAD(P)-dependent dehydrogenase (short-subunit alcohol dehydrogenase family)